MIEQENIKQDLTRREFLRIASLALTTLVLAFSRRKYASAQEPTPPSNTIEVPQDGFLRNTPLEQIVYSKSEVITQRDVKYVAYGEDPVYPEHRSIIADVFINPTGITFYHYRRMEEEPIFGLRVRADDDVFVAIVEKDCNMIPVFLKRVLFGLLILGSEREFFTQEWNRTRDVNDLPPELKGIVLVEQALRDGKNVLYCNFGSRNIREVSNIIVGGIVSSDLQN